MAEVHRRVELLVSGIGDQLERSIGVGDLGGVGEPVDQLGRPAVDVEVAALAVLVLGGLADALERLSKGAELDLKLGQVGRRLLDQRETGRVEDRGVADSAATAGKSQDLSDLVSVGSGLDDRLRQREPGAASRDFADQDAVKDRAQRDAGHRRQRPGAAAKKAGVDVVDEPGE